MNGPPVNDLFIDVIARFRRRQTAAYGYEYEYGYDDEGRPNRAAAADAPRAARG